jgi:hypothetical protein
MTYTQHEPRNLNGEASLYLMIGRIQSDVSHLATGLDVVSEKVDKLERNARRKIIPVPRGWIQSLGITGKQWLLVGLGIGMGLTGTVTPELFQKLIR